MTLRDKITILVGVPTAIIAAVPSFSGRPVHWVMLSAVAAASVGYAIATRTGDVEGRRERRSWSMAAFAFFNGFMFAAGTPNHSPGSRAAFWAWAGQYFSVMLLGGIAVIVTLDFFKSRDARRRGRLSVQT